MHHMPRVKIFKNDLFGGLVSGEFCMHHMSKLFRNQLIEGLVSAVIVRIIRPGPNSSRIGQLKVSFLFFFVNIICLEPNSSGINQLKDQQLGVSTASYSYKYQRSAQRSAYALIYGRVLKFLAFCTAILAVLHIYCNNMLLKLSSARILVQASCIMLHDSVFQIAVANCSAEHFEKHQR